MICRGGGGGGGGGESRKEQNMDTFRISAFGSFSFPPTSLKHEFYGLTSGFTRLIMKTKYVSHNLVSLHVKFHDNQTK